MAVVAGGLGQPESGAIVAGGFGAGDDTPSPFRNIVLSVTSTATTSITAEVLTGDTPPTDPPASGGGWRHYPPIDAQQPRKPHYVDMTLTVIASSVVTIDAISVPNFDAELEQLLLAGVI